MEFLVAVVIFVGVLCMVNLLLMVGVIKRLREHTALLTTLGSQPAPVLDVGEEVGEFATSDVDGEPVRRDMFDDALFAFLSPTCAPCKEKLPKFVEYARTWSGGRDQVLAVVAGDPDLASGMLDALRPVARLIVEESDGAVGAAFQARAYPAVVRVAPDDAGRLRVTDNEVAVDKPAAAVA